MRRSWSIALRLAIWLSLGTGLFWVGAAAISSVVLQHELQEAFDDTLSQSAYRLLPLALHDLREPDEHRGDISAINDLDNTGFTYFVHDRNGKIIIRADDAPVDIASLPDAQGFLSIDGRRAYAISDERSGLGIVVLEMNNHRGEALADAAGALFWPLAALLPLIAGGIWLAVRLAMRPLRRFARDVALRDETNLTPLNAEGQPAELAPIALEVAGLLERLKAAMDAERSFAANSAHELRTPVAGALAQTQRLALELGDHPAKGRVQDVERALRHLSQLSEKLLQLARLEAGFARSDASVDLGPIIALVVRDFDSVQTSSGRVTLALDPAVDLHARINPDAFAIALRNLIQNALIHGERDSQVVISCAAGPVIAVTNDGPVVPAEILVQLGTRFARGNTDASGTGLGLAIVNAIMRQAGGTLTLSSPSPNSESGFCGALGFGRQK